MSIEQWGIAYLIVGALWAAWDVDVIVTVCDSVGKKHGVPNRSSVPFLIILLVLAWPLFLLAIWRGK